MKRHFVKRYFRFWKEKEVANSIGMFGVDLYLAGIVILALASLLYRESLLFEAIIWAVNIIIIFLAVPIIWLSIYLRDKKKGWNTGIGRKLYAFMLFWRKHMMAD